MIDVTVTDNQGVAVDCGDGTNVIALLNVGDVVNCTGEGVALGTPYSNLGSVTGTPAFEDPDNPGSFLPVPGADPVGHDDPSNYTGEPLALDLALQKTLDPATAEGPVYTYIIEVINQGNTSAIDVLVVDYLPEGMTVVDPAWTDQGDGTATQVVPGPVAPGETVVLTIDTEITGFGEFVNLAGIESVQAVHPGTGAPLDLDDIDSVLGDSTNDPLVDDVTDGTDGDEDDSDVAAISIAPPASGFLPVFEDPEPVPEVVAAVPVEEPVAVEQPLALTGSESRRLALLGSLLVLGGSTIVLGARRRARDVEVNHQQLNWQPLD